GHLVGDAPILDPRITGEPQSPELPGAHSPGGSQWIKLRHELYFALGNNHPNFLAFSNEAARLELGYLTELTCHGRSEVTLLEQKFIPFDCGLEGAALAVEHCHFSFQLRQAHLVIFFLRFEFRVQAADGELLRGSRRSIFLSFRFGPE